MYMYIYLCISVYLYMYVYIDIYIDLGFHKKYFFLAHIPHRCGPAGGCGSAPHTFPFQNPGRRTSPRPTFRFPRQKADTRDGASHTRAFGAWMWHVSHLLTFHWPKRVLRRVSHLGAGKKHESHGGGRM